MPAQGAQAGDGMMNWESLIDTLLNVSVFVFIGLLVWLYFKKEPPDEESSRPAPLVTKDSD
jgi:hypothetical protein